MGCSAAISSCQHW
jgi:hypothetical protein